MSRQTLFFNRSSFEHLLEMRDYIEAVELAHRAHAEGRCIEPNLVHADAPNGEYHIKTGGILGERSYYGLKANGGFFQNQQNHGLPNILGVIYLSDAANAYPLAIFESALISKMRTAAATAVAAKRLAPEGDIRLGVIGYGSQAEAQVHALRCVCNIQEIRVGGRDKAKAQAFSEKMQGDLGIRVTCAEIEEVCRSSNLIVTCTPATDYLVQKDWINSGSFIAAVGADSPGKNELEPTIFAAATIVADIKSQVIRVGECQHPIQQGIITESDIHAELGELIVGSKPGRTSESEITIYDSTGTAIQDIACAAYIYGKLHQSPDIPGIDLFS